MSQKLIVIGAGIAGLTTGIYAKKSGFDVTIIEQHTIPGGMCTGWKRKGYTFDGAMHWLTGSAPGTLLNRLWREVGALNDTVNIRYDDPFRCVEHDGKRIYLYRDLQQTQRHFNEISPQDAKMTQKFVSDVKKLSNIQAPVSDIKGVKIQNPIKMSTVAMLKMATALPTMHKLTKMSAKEYIDQFQSPAIRSVLYSIVPDNYSAVSVAFTIATLAAGDGGYSEGGSLAFAKRMADTYTGLGGKIIFGTKVEKIVSNHGAATGVLVNGAVMSADAVIITQEVIAASQQLFDQPPKDAWIAKLKREIKPAACCFLSLGIRAPLKETPIFTLEQPIQCGGFVYETLGFNNYYGYEGYAPEGCTALTVFLGGDSYDFWKKARDEGRYEAEKQAVADQVVHAMLQKYPHLADQFEVVDVATPLTYERYTGSSKGSWMSVMEKGMPSMRACPCMLEEIKGVYFAGHRTMVPGGMPTALNSGRAAAQMVCRQFDKTFISQ